VSFENGKKSNLLLAFREVRVYFYFEKPQTTKTFKAPVSYPSSFLAVAAVCRPLLLREAFET
jgi:hypothetical protein